MSENPALEWNINIQKMEDSNDVVLVPLFYDLRIKLLLAPAMVYQRFLNDGVDETLVAGVSCEVNIMSDVNFSASLQQLSFFTDTSFNYVIGEGKGEGEGVDMKGSGRWKG